MQYRLCWHSAILLNQVWHGWFCLQQTSLALYERQERISDLTWFWRAQSGTATDWISCRYEGASHFHVYLSVDLVLLGSASCEVVSGWLQEYGTDGFWAWKTGAFRWERMKGYNIRESSYWWLSGWNAWAAWAEQACAVFVLAFLVAHQVKSAYLCAFAKEDDWLRILLTGTMSEWTA